jgi:hypothetical protein
MTEPQQPEAAAEQPLTKADLTDDDFKGDDLHPYPGDDDTAEDTTGEAPDAAPPRA